MIYEDLVARARHISVGWSAAPTRAQPRTVAEIAPDRLSQETNWTPARLLTQVALAHRMAGGDTVDGMDGLARVVLPGGCLPIV